MDDEILQPDYDEFDALDPLQTQKVLTDVILNSSYKDHDEFKSIMRIYTNAVMILNVKEDIINFKKTNDVEEKFNYALQILRFASGNTRAFNLVHNPNLFSAIENFGINSEQQEALGVLPDDISAEEKFIAEITDGLIQNATIDESMVMLMHSLSVAKSVELIFMIDVFVKSVDSEKTNQTSKSDLNDHYNTSIIKIVEQELDTLIQMYGQIWNDYFNAENFGFYLSQVLRLEEANIPE